MSDDVRRKDAAVEGIPTNRKMITSESSNGEKERDARGRFTSSRSARVGESDVLAAIWAGDGLASASAVASALDITRETARDHLDALQAAGTLEVTSDDPGTVWRLPDRGE